MSALAGSADTFFVYGYVDSFAYALSAEFCF